MSTVQINGVPAEAIYEIVRPYEVRSLETHNAVGLAALCMLKDRERDHQVLFKGKIAIGTSEAPAMNLESAIITFPNMVANETIASLNQIAVANGCYLGIMVGQKDCESFEDVLPALNRLIMKQPSS